MWTSLTHRCLHAIGVLLSRCSCVMKSTRSFSFLKADGAPLRTGLSNISKTSPFGYDLQWFFMVATRRHECIYIASRWSVETASVVLKRTRKRRRRRRQFRTQEVSLTANTATRIGTLDMRCRPLSALKSYSLKCKAATAFDCLNSTTWFSFRTIATVKQHRLSSSPSSIQSMLLLCHLSRQASLDIHISPVGWKDTLT